MDVPVKATAMRTPPRTGKAETKPTTLLDVHEVEWITRELERLLAREQSGGGDIAGAEGGGRHRRKMSDKASPAPKKGGFLAELLGRHAASICSGDAVNSASAAAAAGVDRRRRPRGRGSFREVEKV